MWTTWNEIKLNLHANALPLLHYTYSFLQHKKPESGQSNLSLAKAITKL
jgi:hypothetical protein